MGIGKKVIINERGKVKKEYSTIVSASKEVGISYGTFMDEMRKCQEDPRYVFDYKGRAYRFGYPGDEPADFDDAEEEAPAKAETVKASEKAKELDNPVQMIAKLTHEVKVLRGYIDAMEQCQEAEHYYNSAKAELRMAKQAYQELEEV